VLLHFIKSTRLTGVQQGQLYILLHPMTY